MNGSILSDFLFDLFYFLGYIMFDPHRVPPFNRIHKYIVDHHGVMQMITAGQARAASVSNDFFAGHRLTRCNRYPAHMGIHAEQSETMVNNNRVAINA